MKGWMVVQVIESQPPVQDSTGSSAIMAVRLQVLPVHDLSGDVDASARRAKLGQLPGRADHRDPLGA